jgi:hypothetical protein
MSGGRIIRMPLKENMTRLLDYDLTPGLNEEWTKHG